MSAASHQGASGGSASTQATSLAARSWQARPLVAWTIRATRTLISFATAVMAVRVVASQITRPSGLAPTLVWLAGLAVIAIGAVQCMDRLTRRLLPIAMLYQLSLVFPDQAPQRFRHALRRGTVRSLHGEGGPDDPDAPFRALAAASSTQEYAERLLALLETLTVHDRRTRGHTERVRAYAQMIGAEIDLSAEELAKLNWGALLHDIGKLDVPSELLNKPSAPSDEEWAVLRTHPGRAAHYVAPLRPWLGDWVDAATQHHERFDGRGYPAGLAGRDISLSGRVVAIADAFDVMTSVRSYKGALPADAARAELSRSAGTQFDPVLVRAFLNVSVGRTRAVVGPLGWLTQLPSFLQIPLATVASTGGVAVASLVSGAPDGLLDYLPKVLAPPAAEVAVDATTSTMAIEDAPPSATDADPNPVPSVLVRVDDTSSTVTVTVSVSVSVAVAVTVAVTGPGPEVTGVPPSADPAGSTGPTPGAPPPTTADTTPPTVPPTATTAPPTTAPPPVTTTTAAGPGSVNAVDDDGGDVRARRSTVIQALSNDNFAGPGVDIGSLQVLSQPDEGDVTVVGQNLRYDASSDTGTFRFTYRICNVAGVCDNAEVTVHVTD